MYQIPYEIPGSWLCGLPQFQHICPYFLPPLLLAHVRSYSAIYVCQTYHQLLWCLEHCPYSGLAHVGTIITPVYMVVSVTQKNNTRTAVAMHPSVRSYSSSRAAVTEAAAAVADAAAHRQSRREQDPAAAVAAGAAHRQSTTEQELPRLRNALHILPVRCLAWCYKYIKFRLKACDS